MDCDEPGCSGFPLSAVGRAAAVLAKKAHLYLGRLDRLRQRWLNREKWAARPVEIRQFMDGH